MITEKVVAACGLLASGLNQSRTVNGLGPLMPTYQVNVLLPSNVQFNVTVLLGQLRAGVDVLIGMDIIAAGDFSATQHEGKTTMSFRVTVPHSLD